MRHALFSAVVGDPPEPFAVWTLDLLAKHMVDNKLVGSISIETLSYWLRTADIKPHQVRGWLNSRDPKFKEKRDRIAALYRNPPKDGELLSVDEKTSIQALERKFRDRPVGPGRRRRWEYEYVRHGTVHLLASFNVRTGQVHYEIPSGKNDSDAFIAFLKQLMKIYPKRKLYLILDNGTTHCSNKTKEFFAWKISGSLRKRVNSWRNFSASLPSLSWWMLTITIWARWMPS